MDILLDCFGGISGDMLVGALIDLGADEGELLRQLDSLGLGCKVEITRAQKNGVTATDFNVLVDTSDHDMDYLYGDKNATIPFDCKRNYFAVEEIINNSSLSQAAKAQALRMFYLLAQAEAKAHGEKFEDVIFHESGAMDSIMDISAIAILLDELNVRKAYFCNLREGTGFIKTRKGLLPIPTPAVQNLADMLSTKLERCELSFELITPTGLVALGCFAKPTNKHFNIVKTAYGNGKRDYPSLGVLKIHQIKGEKNEKVL